MLLTLSIFISNLMTMIMAAMKWIDSIHSSWSVTQPPSTSMVVLFTSAFVSLSTLTLVLVKIFNMFDQIVSIMINSNNQV